MNNPIKQKLEAGNTVIGTWSIISSPMIVEIFSLAGFDFLILDMEHGTYDQTTLDSCIRACEAANCAPLVRVPGVNASATQWALDLGAHGIIVPQVSDFESSVTAVRHTKYPPEGTRGYNPFVRAANYAAPANNHSGKLSNHFGLTSLIIETKQAMIDLEKIVTISDLDMVYVGAYDLSISLGYQGNTKHPDLVKLIENLVVKIVKAGKIAGLMVTTREEKNWAEQLGARFMVYKVDSNIILTAATQAVASLRTVTCEY